ncbi:MAG TPA: response regulator transcription factor [Nocardioides sp.]
MAGQSGGASTGERTVLVVDDDADQRELVVLVLGAAGYRVVEAGSGAEAVEATRTHEPDLVTLDLGLPDMDGTEVCRALREFSDAYVIMLTGRSDESDRLIGLDVGADDYMVKPFSPKELRARVAAVLRRSRPAPERPVSPARSAPASVVDAARGLIVVPDRELALLDGVPLPLTGAEVLVLATLAREPGRAWERRQLVRAVWTEEFGESQFLLDVHVGNLRRKLRKAGVRDEWIRSVGGNAYQFIPTPGAAAPD